MLPKLRLCKINIEGGTRIGVVEGDVCYDLTSSDPSFLEWSAIYMKAGSLDDLLSVVQKAMKGARKLKLDYSFLRAPIKPAEIWAAGVTYLRSRQARESETRIKGLYDYVYTSERPELFLKDSNLRCVGPNEDICIRNDSKWTVPEPELCVVLDDKFEIFGYTCGNDVSARDIEGENPLFLPQAKVYKGSSAIGPVITTRDEVSDPHALQIMMRISRNDAYVFEGEVNTSQMKRSVEELVSYLRRNNVISTFTVLMTGTSIVPPDDFSLQDGDIVEIEIEKIGLLRNKVRQLH